MDTKSAIVLQVTPSVRTKLIITYLSQYHGVETSVFFASKKRDTITIQPLLFADVLLASVRQQKNIATIKQITTTYYPEHLARSYHCFMLAHYFMQLIRAIVPSGKVESDWYHLLSKSLRYLNEEKIASSKVTFLMLLFEKRCTQLLGIYTVKYKPHELLQQEYSLPNNIRKKCLQLSDSS